VHASRIDEQTQRLGSSRREADQRREFPAGGGGEVALNPDPQVTRSQLFDIHRTSCVTLRPDRAHALQSCIWQTSFGSAEAAD
jgi:hypothetical protein